MMKVELRMQNGLTEDEITPAQKVPEHGNIMCYQSKQILERDDMKVTYNPDVDVLRIIFRDAPVEESDEDKPGVILDYDKDGNVVGLEVLNVSERVENPRGVDYAVTT